ncbi:uncharacterized protein LOC114784391 isoform X2 [Denticeps clupeoides]|uniref:uncharacterized protein LOC114784391 isoform X2 n=1 Tax=Denticeps clupeoides TaxID=299321 RepID=UPI0010A37740|nr:uncharacterized protein LOC114784391 isoform X2 [Denticeps clupeoides]
MTRLQRLGALLTRRLTLAAQEIYRDVEEVILHVQEESSRTKQENRRLRERLRALGITDLDESDTDASATEEIWPVGNEDHQNNSCLMPSLQEDAKALHEQNQGDARVCGPQCTSTQNKNKASPGRPPASLQVTEIASVPLVQLRSPSHGAEDGEPGPSALSTPMGKQGDSVNGDSACEGCCSSDDNNNNNGDSDDPGSRSSNDKRTDLSSHPSPYRLRKRKQDHNGLDDERAAKEKNSEMLQCRKQAMTAAEEDVESDDEGSVLCKKQCSEISACGSFLGKSFEEPQLGPSAGEPKPDSCCVSVLGESRWCTKKNYCLFCRKQVLKISRHLECMHREEEEVAKALSFPKNSEERRILWGVLRKKGNHVYNEMVENVSSYLLPPRPKASANGIPLLTFVEDVKKLHVHLKDKQAEYDHMLLSDFSSETWGNLAKVTLAQLTMFNTRSSEELSQMSLSAFISRDISVVPSDDAEITEFEQELCKYSARIEISAGEGRKISLLVPPSVLKSIESLVVKRMLCGIRYDNKHLFAQPRGTHYFKGADCVEDFAKDCGVQHPQVMRLPRLQMEVATLCRLLYLKEVDHLTDFMGLDVKWHLVNECCNKETVQLAKLCKIFVMVERGLQDCTGKSVDEIHICNNEILELATAE